MWTFTPILKSTIWGGSRIAPFKGIDTQMSAIGESWEVSGVPGSESVVAEGPDAGLTLPQLIDKYGLDLLGKKNFSRFGHRFPLLIKFIDAAADLSVQVHPDDEMARRHGSPNGKTEMWYMIDAAPGARLALGFNRPVDPATLRPLLDSGDIESLLRYIPVKAGDAFLIPAGTVHAIGPGCLIAEIQQTSDDTYRLYDYRRRDAAGNLRPLHIDLAMEATDFNYTQGAPQHYTPVRDIPVCLASTPYFTTNVLHLDMEVMRDYREMDSFVILIAVRGKATVACGESKATLPAGRSLLIPASAKGVVITPEGDFSALETYIR